MIENIKISKIAIQKKQSIAIVSNTHVFTIVNEFEKSTNEMIEISDRFVKNCSRTNKRVMINIELI